MLNPPTLGDHSQPLNVQYLVHIAFVHINHTDQFKYSFKESSEVTGDHCKNNYLQLQCWVHCLYTMYNTYLLEDKQTPNNKSPPASETGKSPASIGIFSYM